MQKEFIIGILITIILLLVVIWAIFVRKEKFSDLKGKALEAAMEAEEQDMQNEQDQEYERELRELQWENKNQPGD